jgi:hypothetical protein
MVDSGIALFCDGQHSALSAPAYSQHREIPFCWSEEIITMFNYLTNSSGFTRITAYVGQLLDGAVDEHIDELSQKLRPDPATRGLNRPYDLSELMSRTIAP